MKKISSLDLGDIGPIECDIRGHVYKDKGLFWVEDFCCFIKDPFFIHDTDVAHLLLPNVREELEYELIQVWDERTRQVSID